MSFAAGHAARGGAATVSLPMGQLAMVGIGALCVTNPDKFFLALSQGAHFFATVSNAVPHHLPQQNHHQQPIIIHQAAPATVTTGSGRRFMVQLFMGAGLCWGSYMVLVTVLPDAAKALLPVNQKVFNKAVTALGRAVLNLKDTLMAQINALSQKQDDLSNKQDSTHEEVLEIKHNVVDIKGDLALVQEALDLCHASLSESERRTSYIARGVQLLTRGVSTILPEDENLLHDLVQFNIAGDEFQQTTTLQQHRLRQAVQAIHAQQQGGSSSVDHQPPIVTVIGSESHASNPENDIPATPVDVEQSVYPIVDLLKQVQVGQ